MFFRRHHHHRSAEDCEAGSCCGVSAVTPAEISTATPVINNSSVRGGMGDGSFNPILPPVVGGDVDPDGSSFLEEGSRGSRRSRGGSRRESGVRKTRSDVTNFDTGGEGGGGGTGGTSQWGYETPRAEEGVSSGVGENLLPERRAAASRGEEEEEEEEILFEGCVEPLNASAREERGRIVEKNCTDGASSSGSSSGISIGKDNLFPVSVWAGRRRHLLLGRLVCAAIVGLAAGLAAVASRSRGGAANAAAADVGEANRPSPPPATDGADSESAAPATSPAAPIEDGAPASSTSAANPTSRPMKAPVTDERDADQ